MVRRRGSLVSLRPAGADLACLHAGLRKFPSAMGRQTVDVDGHQLGRTALVAEYILRRTGKNRSRGQVGSRVQFLRHRYSDDKTCESSC